MGSASASTVWRDTPCVFAMSSSPPIHMVFLLQFRADFEMECIDFRRFILKQYCCYSDCSVRGLSDLLLEYDLGKH